MLHLDANATEQSARGQSSPELNSQNEWLWNGRFWRQAAARIMSRCGMIPCRHEADIRSSGAPQSLIDAFGTRFFAAKYTSQKGGYWKAPLLSTSKPRGGGGVRRFFTPDYTYPS
jgi:hypothetical protein